MNLRRAGRESALGRSALAGLLALVFSLGLVVSLVYADTTYRVQPGDTLSGIALRYGVTVEAIMAANNLASRSTIYAGQVLTIPSASNPAPPPPAQNGQSVYIVQPGDNLSTIAYHFGTTTDAIMQANGLTSTTIFTGQRLTIPAPGSPAQPPPAQPTPTSPPPPTATPVPPTPTITQPQANPDTYVVQPGDNLTMVAQRFGVTRQALAAANGISPSSFLYVGQILKIPSNGIPPAATAVPATPVQGIATPTVSAPAALPTTTPEPAQAGGNTNGKPLKYTVQYGDSLSSIAAKFNTTTDALIALNNLNDANFLYVGQVLTIVKGNDQDTGPATTPVPEPTPPMGEHGIKWIDVNLTTQMMVAYEGQTPVFSSKISSGVANHPTVEGTFRVYAKYRSTLMQGGTGAEHYYIPNVPYTMYFYSGYALHGAFWHNNFGHPMSHGCVNLPVDASKWMFDWAPIGTMVVTHE